MSRRASTLAIVLISQAAGLLMLAMVLPLLPESTPNRFDIAWGAAAGLAGGTGVALLYRALAIGVMAVVAPTTAVCAVALPVLVAIAFGERPSSITLAGIALALVAIVLVSRPAHSAETSGGPVVSEWLPLGLSLLSGVAIGLFYIALAQTGERAGVWPLIGARAASVTLFGCLAAASAQSLRLPPRALLVVVSCGGLDMLANLLYLVATRSGPLAVVVTLASLYPASTVLLARVVLHEPLSGGQWAGVFSALVAVGLIVGA
jgi:drug/metabolite transporter (DMT)-like permease